MTRRGAGLQERVFRILLHAYPRQLREAHGEEMLELFRVRAAGVSGVRGRWSLWRALLADFGVNVVGAWRGEGSRVGRRNRRRDMTALLQDVRYAFRYLRRAPLFTISALALLAVGIGANTAVFTIVNALLLRPPPYAHPERVVDIYQDSDDGEPSSNSFPAYRDMAQSRVFAAVAATSPGEAALETSGGPVPVETEYVTSSYLDVMGLQPSRGRWFSRENDVVGSAPLAVVSYAAWQSRFAADPSIVGRVIRLNSQPVTVVGVGPKKLTGSVTSVVTDFWLSISATTVGGAGRVANLERRQDHWYFVMARLAQGVTVGQAQAAMNALAARLAEEYPELDRGRDITVFRAEDVRMHPGSDHELYSAGGILMVIVGLILVLACGNLANLLLVRGLARSGEVAVRRALGAGRRRVARMFLTESLLLSCLGGVGGVLLAKWALSFLPRMPLPYPLSATLVLGMDHRVILFSAGLMIATGILFGLAPAVRSMRTDVAGTLRDEARTTSMGRGTARVSRLLVALQLAASLVLVLGAGLLARSLAALQHVNTGVDADRVAYLRTDVAQAGVSGPEAAVLLKQVQARIAAAPGVTAAAFSTRLPAQHAGTTTTVIEGYEPPTGTGAVELNFAIVSPAYFSTMGLSLLAGRNFGSQDRAGTETVVIVNQTMAHRFWGSRDPIGRRIRAQSRPDSWRRVVGVVEDAPVSSLSEPVRPMFYVAAAQAGLSSPYILARTNGNPAALLGTMRRELKAVRSTFPVTEQGTLRAHFGEALAAPRFAAESMGLFSLLAVLLASLGIYAVVAFGVARRSAELGIRMALGASRLAVVRLVVGEVSGTVLLGLAAGVALAIAAAPKLADALYGVAPLDIPTFIASALFLLAVALLAAYLPARRAARLNPMASLRS